MLVFLSLSLVVGDSDADSDSTDDDDDENDVWFCPLKPQIALVCSSKQC